MPSLFDLANSEYDAVRGYKISDLDTADPSNQYFGYLNKDGGWYIMYLTTTEARYVKGDSGYSDAWNFPHADLSYDYFDAVF